MQFEQVYAEAKRIARAQLAKHASQTLSTTDLLHEAYLKLAQAPDVLPAADRLHTVNLVTRVLRQVLVDAARRRLAEKRGSDPLKVVLDTSVPAAQSGVDVLALDQALQQLKHHNERMALVVELHFFGGVEFSEIAELLGVDRRTVHRDWTAARLLLARALEAG